MPWTREDTTHGFVRASDGNLGESVDGALLGGHLKPANEERLKASTTRLPSPTTCEWPQLPESSGRRQDEISLDEGE